MIEENADPSTNATISTQNSTVSITTTLLATNTTTIATTQIPTTTAYTPPETPSWYNPSKFGSKILPSNDHAEALAKMITDEIWTELDLQYENRRWPAHDFLSFILKMNGTLNLQPNEVNGLLRVVDYLKNTEEFDVDEYEVATSSFPESTGDYSDYCRGSTKNRRGYTCTLWRLFHVSWRSAWVSNENVRKWLKIDKNYQYRPF